MAELTGIRGTVRSRPCPPGSRNPPNARAQALIAPATRISRLAQAGLIGGDRLTQQRRAARNAQREDWPVLDAGEGAHLARICARH